MSFTTAVVPRPTETFGEKIVRKFKEEPLVPIGTVATCTALIIAATKLRKGDSKSLNNWLRMRVIFQGLTVAAIVAGSYQYGRTQKQLEEKARMDQERLLAQAAKERAAFEERLKGAEEAHAAEQRARSSSILSKLTGGISSSPPAGDANKVSKVARVEEVKESEGRSGGVWSWLGWSSGSSSNAESSEKKS